MFKHLTQEDIDAFAAAEEPELGALLAKLRVSGAIDELIPLSFVGEGRGTYPECVSIAQREKEQMLAKKQVPGEGSTFSAENVIRGAKKLGLGKWKDYRIVPISPQPEAV